MEGSFIAYAIFYGEQSCGCPSTTFMHVYDNNGMQYKRFSTRAEAEVAAKAKMKEYGADNWQVL